MFPARRLAIVSFVVACTGPAPDLVFGAGFAEHHLQTLHGEQAGAGFGAAIARADVNADGWPDVIVGAPDFDGAAGEDCGKAFLFYGSADGIASTPAWSAEGELIGAAYGRTVASAGDVNGDGFEDVVVGSPEYSPPYYWRVFPGRIYLYLGSPDGLAATPSFVAEGEYDFAPYDGIGGQLRSGDFNGDGFSDVLAAQYSRYNGRADVFYGSAAGLSHERATGLSIGAHSGNSIAAADINGDGFDDVALTRVEAQAGQQYLGGAVFLGSPGGVQGEAVFSDERWFHVGSPGDVDRDGYGDLLVAEGHPHNDPALAHTFYRGSPTGPRRTERTPVFIVPTDNPPSRFDALGDINGDGFPDLMAGDGIFIYLYLGTRSGFRPLGDGMARSDAVFAAGGDLNRDGFGDILRGDRASERVDVYRGARDWSLPVTADLALNMIEQGAPTDWGITVTNRGPDVARARLIDIFPAAPGKVRWICGGAGALGCDFWTERSGDITHVLTALTQFIPTSFYIGFRPGVLPIVNTASLVLPHWVTDPDLSNNSASAVVSLPRTALFTDGFETGSLAAWSTHASAGLAVGETGALDGRFSLAVTPSESGAAIVRDESPQDDTSYHAQFRVDASELLRFAPPFVASLFVGRSAAGATLFDVRIERRGQSTVLLVARTLVNDGTMKDLPPVDVGRGPHVVDIGWRRASDATVEDGLLMLRVDSRDVGTLSLPDNHAVGTLDHVDLGLTVHAFRPLMASRRAVVLDSFASWRVH